jgi:hypothetical protein
MRALFNAFDEDRSGGISFQEIEAMLEAPEPGPRPSPGRGGAAGADDPAARARNAELLATASTGSIELRVGRGDLSAPREPNSGSGGGGVRRGEGSSGFAPAPAGAEDPLGARDAAFLMSFEATEARAARRRRYETAAVDEADPATGGAAGPAAKEPEARGPAGAAGEGAEEEPEARAPAGAAAGELGAEGSGPESPADAAEAVASAGADAAVERPAAPSPGES